MTQVMMWRLYIVYDYCLQLRKIMSDLSLVVRKPVFGVRSDTNPAVQPQKMARGLKFRI